DVEYEQRTEIGFHQRLAHARQPIAVETPVIDALLEIHAHGSERRQRAAPVVARVDVVGADLADRLVHGGLLPVVWLLTGSADGARRRPGAALCWAGFRCARSGLRLDVQAALAGARSAPLIASFSLR